MARESLTAGELPRGILPFPGARLRGGDGARRLPAPARTTDAEEDWDALCERLLDRWPQLTSDELEATHGKPDLVDAVLEAKLGYARRLVEELFLPWRLQRLQASRARGRVTRGLLRLVSLTALASCGLLLR
ncbi:MAG: hypothetical protein K1X87_10525 [Dehalococcoidia bacterium]|nr:hypothetical protein [Dehalococcoidia bacterium]